ncbi:transposase [Nitratireductor indicus C115]|uniref:Transposase n=1 Tax=Nitratireductor indicus C115 TaxID=1231190 RepID=K2NSM0_9HYPH|nr:transposase [Nitratireductor indicus C115]SFQ59486.1 Putative transposase of IS4/5 family [Nitratireductor indicus]
MDDLFCLSERQKAQISPFFPSSYRVPRIDNRQMVSGIIYVIRNCLHWKDSPSAYGPHKTLYNRFVRWSLMGCSTASSRGWPEKDQSPSVS